MSGNQYDRLIQKSFLEAAAALSSREKNINITERRAQGASAVCKKKFTDTSQLNMIFARMREHLMFTYYDLLGKR